MGSGEPGASGMHGALAEGGGGPGLDASIRVRGAGLDQDMRHGVDGFMLVALRSRRRSAGGQTNTHIK